MFAEKFLELLVKEVKRSGLSDIELGRRVWPNRPNPDQTWQRIKKISPKIQKKQQIKLSEAYKLVEALNQNMALFCLRVLNEIEKMKIDNTNSNNGSKRKRKKNPS